MGDREEVNSSRKRFIDLVRAVANCACFPTVCVYVCVHMCE